MTSKKSDPGADPVAYTEYALGTLLNILGKVLHDDTNAAMTEIGLTSEHVGVLWAVELDPGRSQIEYAQMRFRDPTTFGRHVDLLVEKGLLRRTELPDRRAKAVHITPAGLKVIEQARAAIREVEARATRSISEKRRQALFETLNDILADLRSDRRG